MKMKTTLASLIGAMVIGTTGYVGYQTYEKNKVASESDLFLENIEALAEDSETSQEDEETLQRKRDCFAAQGNWDEASHCASSGFESTTCTISGSVSLFGVTLTGSYEKGKSYNIPWARYECGRSTGNCCKKQGLYSGDTKLA